MKLNTITRVMVFAALTSASHLALAAGSDSQDYQASMTVAKQTCSLSVTPSNTNFGFTYTYAQADEDNDTLGTMVADSAPASVHVSVPDGCDIGHIRLDVDYTGGAKKISKNMAGISTNNGGVFPFFIGIRNINFYTDSAGTAGKAYAYSLNKYGAASTDSAGTGTLQYGIVNNNSKYGTVNGGYPLLAASAASGMMTYGGPNHEDGTSYGASFVTAGIFKVANDNDNPLASDRAATGRANEWAASDGPGSFAPGAGSFASVTAEFVAAVSLYPYNEVTKEPDPMTVYDTQGNADSISATATLTVTKV
ncbi:hypothetical protein JAF88_004801 [Citrobacter freundii]|uniref:hypothetical protein n=1 Tax=Klebsiella aerogenes TaxID=548 RepID=UPI000574A600|nr:hypothetical protein [Klebsiella aerogenes]EGT0627982.1 hypothetical protein [Citrobacter freundii]KHM32366.1 hypothetical protein KV34_13330 [Klebsiella aerogenes]